MIYTLIYLTVGIVLAIHWFKRDYEPEYKELERSEEGVEKGMAELLIMFMAIFWPLKLIYNLVTKGKV
jgi:hypothetical protein